jgi:hypothetical protein
MSGYCQVCKSWYDGDYCQPSRSEARMTALPPDLGGPQSAVWKQRTGSPMIAGPPLTDKPNLAGGVKLKVAGQIPEDPAQADKLLRAKYLKWLDEDAD